MFQLKIESALKQKGQMAIVYLIIIQLTWNNQVHKKNQIQFTYIQMCKYYPFEVVSAVTVNLVPGCLSLKRFMFTTTTVSDHNGFSSLQFNI